MNRQFDFDELVDRRKVAALKYNAASMKRIFGEADLFPSWVADMDFKAAPSVIAGLEARAAHGVFGYEYRPGSLTEAIVAWNRERHGWDIAGEHLLTCPSVLNAVAVLVNLFSNEGDGVIVQPPVFFDFKLIINNNGRRLVKNPLKLEDGRYRMDFVDLESRASDPANKLLILCNPHNPVGRVWSRDELERVGDICRRHDVLVIADEIHADIVFRGHRYTPFASLSDALADISFTCLSPAKSFNIAGACNASLVIANDARRTACAEFYNRFEINKNNAFANVAMEEAYRHGAPWLDGVLDYLEENVALVRDYFSRHVPAARLIEPEGTFLLWLDLRGLGLDVEALQHFLVHEARLGLNMGHWFGRE
ncbi:MAG: pyridoxal phosphate-dependent aminotransferase, partial [Gammaproteobacteria bacterium]|nr:pyridoxal phosphate-dependent aminotransferase [Gammaproteobacteria bacterium]